MRRLGSRIGAIRGEIWRRMILPLLGLTCLVSQGQGQKAIIAVIDGARYSETFGAGGRNIPRIWNELRPQGTIWTSYRNQGVTATVPGHSSILTGTWQEIANDGSERPTKPVLFEYFRKAHGAAESLAQIVVGKSKLRVLAYGTDPEYGEAFGARATICASDTDVCRAAIEVMRMDSPDLLLVNFPDVDLAGHRGDWEGYLGAIRRVDSLVAELWRVVRTDPEYRNNTLFFVTNDHGRHLDSVSTGFSSHGDDCEGCRHLLLFGAGGGLSKGYECRVERDQRDISASIGEWLGIPVPQAEGTSLLGDTIKATGVGTRVKEGEEELRLLGVYPNPFNPTTRIGFVLGFEAEVEIRVVDLQGREVEKRYNQFHNPGANSFNFNGQTLASGVYFYELRAGRSRERGSMMLIR